MVNQELYDLLETIANLNLHLEDVANQLPNITDEDLQETVEKFSEEITEYREEDFVGHVDDSQGYIRIVIDMINERI